jgi:hypothetical protein
MIKSRSPFETILVLVGACIVLYLIFSIVWILWTALGLIVLSVLFPSMAKIIDKAWFGLAEAIGFVTGRILFSSVYIILLLPLALLFKKRLSINLTRKDGSLFTERNHLYTAKDMENIW